MNLDEIRKKIDETDSKIIPLINERMEYSLAVSEIKRSQNLPVYQPEREKEILDRVERTSGRYGSYVRSIYGSIMTVSRSLQNDLLFGESAFAEKILGMPSELRYKRIICQGVEGAFSHAAAKKLFPEAVPEFRTSFEDVFAEIEKDGSAIGVLPAENSNAGAVNTVYDLLLEYSHYIVKAATIDVSQNLLTVGPAERVRTVYSHPHAIKQCERYIKEHGITAVESENTAIAAKYVAGLGDETIAAIGSEEAAKLYGLNIGERGIQAERNNLTRFIAVSKSPCIAPDSNTVSLALSVPHEKGSLYSMLGRFADCGLNLTKIESRPAGQRFEYKFYIDFAGSVRERHTLNLLSSLDSELSYFVFLGNYPDR